MDNNAFKELVQKQAGGPSSKEIARKAVETEFQKKKRKRGGGYASSSDEEEGDDEIGRKRKQRGKGEENEEEDEEDTEKAIQEDLASRYRDRAKERREGVGGGDESDGEENDQPVSLAVSDFLIVPHNKKGLDLSLVRKERQGLKKSGNEKDIVAEMEMRKEMPSLEEAHEILSKHAKESSSAPTLSRGLNGYIQEFVNRNNEKIEGKYDTVTCGTNGKTLQKTKLAFAIDGHPSDAARAWQRPRPYTLSEDNRPGNTTAMMTSQQLGQIDRIFAARQKVLSQMKEAALKTVATKVESKSMVDDEDDDIFGGLDDYVPAAPKKKA